MMNAPAKLHSPTRLLSFQCLFSNVFMSSRHPTHSLSQLSSTARKISARVLLIVNLNMGLCVRVCCFVGSWHPHTKPEGQLCENDFEKGKKAYAYALAPAPALAARIKSTNNGLD